MASYEASGRDHLPVPARARACASPTVSQRKPSITAKAWQRVERIRAYCDAVENRHPGDLRAEAGEWVAWARAYADRVDPLGSAPERCLRIPMACH